MTRVEFGIPEIYREDAARLYWQAFSGKLGRLLGHDTRAIPFLAEILNLGKAAYILDDGKLVGVAGFDTGDGGFVEGVFRDLKRHYGLWGALWRAPFFAALERPSPDDYLQLDGIAVDPAFRGLGLGTALLSAICERAEASGLCSVSLNVIDNNPRARALYERFGFEAVSSEALGPFRLIFGFKSATKMVHQIE